MAEKLKEYCTVISGYAFKSKDLSEGTDIPIIKIGNISNGENVVIDDATQYVNDEFLSIDKKYHIQNGDILISLTGSHMNQPNSMVGRCCRNLDDAVYLLNQRAGKIIPKKTVNKDFLYYVFRLKSIQYAIANRAYGGANQVNVSPKDVMGIKFAIPDITVQNRIADILVSYDSLIQNNNKRIRLLEQMADNLYKEWFVRFRFPRYESVEFKDSSLGKIPTIFDVVKIGILIDYYIGGGWGEEEASEQFSQEAFVVRGTDFPNVRYGVLNSCPLRYHKQSNYEKRKFEVNDIAFEVSGGTQEQPVGRSIMITERQLDRFNNKLICASFCKQIRCNPQKINPRYLYHWLQYMYDTRMIDQFQLQSTGIINFKFEYFLRKGNVLMPQLIF